MKILAIVRTNLVRASRDRTALFFAVLLPLILILVLGLTYGAGSSARIGVVELDDGPLASRLTAEIRATPDLSVDLRSYGSLEALRDAASRGIVQVGLVIPPGYSATLEAGGNVELTLVSPPTEAAAAVQTTLQRAIASQAALVRAARLSSSLTGASFGRALENATALASRLPGVSITVVPVNAAARTANGYDSGAQGQLILFMFLTSLTGAAELVITRQLGISRRMFSTPTGPWTIISGEALARIAFALVQGIFIVFASALLFGVRWGDPVGLTAVVLAFALVAGGAAMVVGSVASNPSQAGAIGPALAMLLGLVGGTMVPADVFPDAMRQLSHLTPHAWAMEGLQALSEPGSGITRVLPQIGILLLFAAVFFSVAVARFRRVLVGGS